MNALRKIFNPKVRTFLYAQATVVGSVLVFVGYFNEVEVAFWIGVVDTVVGNSVAFFHTPETNHAVTEERPL